RVAQGDKGEAGSGRDRRRSRRDRRQKRRSDRTPRSRPQPAQRVFIEERCVPYDALVFLGLGLLGIGVGVGTFGTLVGAGGGFLLVPILSLLEPGLPPSSVTAVSLAVVAMNATSGALAYYRQRRIDLRSGIPFAIATLPGSFAGVLLTRLVTRSTFDIVFAALLIGLAVFVLLAHEDEP